MAAYMHTHTCSLPPPPPITVKKKGHEFEREQGGLHGRDWKEGSEGGNYVIII